MVGAQRDMVIPSVVVDPQSGRSYQKGRFLGKGGFAHCFELTETVTKAIFAGKIVPKTLLQKKHQKDKMAQEVRIHGGLCHPNVVRLEGFFEDNELVYVLLELCPRRSLMELQKRRKVVTEPEARYFLKQIVNACQYLHEKRVIHRDLKLGNLFLTDEMDVKIGDFGLATIVEDGGEMKKTLCGTPNYIAPEMLDKKGHSFEVDIWAIGCILYTLLVGRPPFETNTLKDTYDRIKRNDYRIPSSLLPDAAVLIKRLLTADPILRPKVQELLKFDFFARGYTPSRLPVSCLTTAPKFSAAVLGEVDRFPRNLVLNPQKGTASAAKGSPAVALSVGKAAAQIGAEGDDIVSAEVPKDCYLSSLFAQLSELLSKRPSERNFVREEEAEDPAATPVFWVMRWVDYSDKYGIGYQLCDNSVGVVFNDCTKIVLNAAGERLQYIGKDNSESFYTKTAYPVELSKKVTLLNYFQDYMHNNLARAGANVHREGDEHARLPFMRVWFRTRSAIILFLNNGTLQINFFQDHTKLILCPLMGAVTYSDPNRNFRVFRFDLIGRYGCSKDLCTRLKYARMMVQRLMSNGDRLMGSTLSGSHLRNTCGNSASVPPRDTAAGRASAPRTSDALPKPDHS